MKQFNNVIVACVAMVCCQLTIATSQTLPEAGPARITHYVTAGFNIGATLPFSLPDNIRAIESYTPLLIPSVGYSASFAFNDRWGVGLGARLDVKGMKVRDSVLYLQTIITMDDGAGGTSSFSGAFSGTNETDVRNVYVTLPITAEYQSTHWRYGLGLYLAYLLSPGFKGEVTDGYIRRGNSLGEKVTIDRATFDFSDNLRKSDWGVHLLAERRFGAHWGAQAAAQIGFQSVFPSSFTGIAYSLNNMYLSLGASYRIK